MQDIQHMLDLMWDRSVDGRWRLPNAGQFGCHQCSHIWRSTGRDVRLPARRSRPGDRTRLPAFHHARSSVGRQATSNSAIRTAAVPSAIVVIVLRERAHLGRSRACCIRFETGASRWRRLLMRPTVRSRTTSSFTASTRRSFSTRPTRSRSDAVRGAWKTGELSSW